MSFNITSIVRSVANTVNKHAPEILTGVGLVLGVGALAGTAVGSIRATKIVEEMKKEDPEKEPEKLEIVKATWKEFVPAVTCTVASAACFVGATSISLRRLATVTAAYAISESSLKEYKDKALEIVGPKKEEEIRAAANQAYIDAHPAPKNLPYDGSRQGVVKCLDKFTGQYFWNDADTIRRMVNCVNDLLIHDYSVSVNDFITEIGETECTVGDGFGWNVTRGDLIEIEFTTNLDEADNPVLVLEYRNAPVPNFRNYLDV